MRARLAAAVVLMGAVLGAQGPGFPPGQGPDGPGPEGAAVDPPSRVARLSWIEGQVSFQPASVDTWTAATLNYPLTTGDHIYADVASRAEMEIGRNTIRLNSQSNFGFLNLDDRTVQIQFTGGAMEARLRFLDDQDLYEVDTPNGAISLLRAGDYRIDTDPDRNGTMVTVFAGEVEVTANGQSFAVHPRETGWFTDGAPPNIRGLNQPDDFDRFTTERNRRDDAMPPARHVNPQMIGGEDLDIYGTWRDEPGYGPVWAPPVPVGWAPYRSGHWAWVAPWGWTWIDDAPWGFAPFHYGRWAMVRGGWVWIPGAVAARPVYAPALVAFVGGPHFSLGIGIGGGGPIGAVAWFPLGPQEVYRPAYAVSPLYVRNVNITSVTNVTTITNVNVTNVRYVNQGLATAVPQNAFATGRPVAQVAVRVTPQMMANAQISHGALVAPRRESVLASAAPNQRVAQPPAAMMARQVVAKTTPPPPPVSFQSQQAALAENQGRPLAPAQVAQIRQQQPAGVASRPMVRTAAAPSVAPAAPAAAPRNRFESRPPTATQPAGNAQPAARAPEFNRPSTAAQPAARPSAEPASRPARAEPAARPAPQNRPPTRVQKKEKDEKKDERR